MKILLQSSVMLFALVACSGGDASDDTADATNDGNGTTTTTTTTTTNGELTWKNFGKDFMLTYCVQCHSPGGQASADFNKYNIVIQRLNAIKCGVAPEQLDGCEGEHPPGWFPVGDGPFPTDDERWQLVEWIDNDAPRG